MRDEMISRRNALLALPFANNGACGANLMKFGTFQLRVAAMLSITLAGIAHASATPDTTWNFGGACTWSGYAKCASVGVVSNVTGNVYTYGASSGPGGAINAEAYHIARTGSGGQVNDPVGTAIRKDFLSDSSGGLGVENINSPEQGVDNSDGWDFVIFQLPTGLDYHSFDISLSALGGGNNMDFTVFYGTPDPKLMISSLQSFYLKNVNQLLAGGFMSMNFTGLFNGSTTETVSVSSANPVSYLIVAASLEPLRISDNFKVNAIVGSTAVRVAEPHTLAALGAGLFGIGVMARRRRVVDRKKQAC